MRLEPEFNALIYWKIMQRYNAEKRNGTEQKLRSSNYLSA